MAWLRTDRGDQLLRSAIAQTCSEQTTDARCATRHPAIRQNRICFSDNSSGNPAKNLFLQASTNEVGTHTPKPHEDAMTLVRGTYLAELLDYQDGVTNGVDSILAFEGDDSI